MIDITTRKNVGAIVRVFMFVIFFLSVQGFSLRSIRSGRSNSSCETPGWFPTGFGVKDHTIFWDEGYYYIMGNYVPGEKFFAYARSIDMCTWEDLTPVLAERVGGAWDESAVWAPYVNKDDGTFFAYYTGVTQNFSQSIMLATTTTPQYPGSWQPQGMIFQPDHMGMVWKEGEWADCRDPMVLKMGGLYYLYYTGQDTGGGIIGVATSSFPSGPWFDWGSIIPPLEGAMAESVTVIPYSGYYYLFYNHTGEQEYFQTGATPAGPWQEAYPFRPGWAHEIWQAVGGEWHTSHLRDYAVYISPLTWDTFYLPPHPSIGQNAFHSIIPLLISQGR